MKKIIISIVFIFIANSVYADKPMIGLFSFDVDSPRAYTFTNLIETHFENIIQTTGVFDSLKTQQLKRELYKFDCTDVKCLIRFARDAGLKVFLTAKVKEHNKSIHLAFTAYGLDAPYFGKVIYRYSVRVPFNVDIATREFSYICEEHSGNFFAGLYRNLKLPVYIQKGTDGTYIVENDISGSYHVFRFKKPRLSYNVKIIENITKVTIDDGIIKNGNGQLRSGDFIYRVHTDKSTFLENFYSGRKKEIVFSKTSYTDTLYTMLLTVPISASMPFVTPVLGHYSNSDWKGLGLWSLNCAPYLYLEYDGFTNDPDDLEGDHKDISQRVRAHNRFAWYMFLVGGLPLFVDAVSHNYLMQAANYRGMQSYMGNNLTAAYLSLVSGGGGHFYRGRRSWGYFYFHLNNILVYSIIWEISPGKKYDSANGRYETGDIDYDKVYMLVGIYGAVKVFEVVHAVLSEDEIGNGEYLQEQYSFLPLIRLEYDARVSYGLQCTYRF